MVEVKSNLVWDELMIKGDLQEYSKGLTRATDNEEIGKEEYS